MKAVAVLIFAAALAAPAAAADRHEGMYRFAPAPEQHCREQVREMQARPTRPLRLGELPPAYAIRLKNVPKSKATACFRIKRER
jgi:hypothetical protein